MPVVDEAGAGIGTGSIELVGGGGCCFGTAPSAEQMWLVAAIEANPVVNMMVPHWHRVWEIGGDLGDGSPLGDMMARVDEMTGVDRIVGTRVVSESSS